jgi:hypothetical protein
MRLSIQQLLSLDAQNVKPLEENLDKPNKRTCQIRLILRKKGSSGDNGNHTEIALKRNS